MNCFPQLGCSQTCGRTPLCIRSVALLADVVFNDHGTAYHVWQGRFFGRNLYRKSYKGTPFGRRLLQIVAEAEYSLAVVVVVPYRYRSCCQVGKAAAL
jgi:hypothetical protein